MKKFTSMEKPFWFLVTTVLVIGAFIQFSPKYSATPPLLATGMPPQIALIEEIASDNGWTVGCRGRSGDLTVVSLEPRAWHSQNSSEALHDKLTLAASTIQTGHDQTGCDLPEDHYEILVTADDSPWIIGVGPKEYLQPLLEIARSCAVKGAQLTTTDIQSQQIYDGEIPTDWVGLRIDPKLESRTGPLSCLLVLTERYRQETELSN